MNLSSFSKIYQNILSEQIKSQELGKVEANKEKEVKPIPYTPTIIFAKTRI